MEYTQFLLVLIHYMYMYVVWGPPGGIVGMAQRQDGYLIHFHRVYGLLLMRTMFPSEVVCAYGIQWTNSLVVSLTIQKIRVILSQKLVIHMCTFLVSLQSFRSILVV